MAQGTFTEFAAAGAGSGPGQGTVGTGINTTGTIVGYYIDYTGVYHGYVRATSGTISEFNVTGAGTQSGQGTGGAQINASGIIAGEQMEWAAEMAAPPFFECKVRSHLSQF